MPCVWVYWTQKALRCGLLSPFLPAGDLPGKLHSPEEGHCNQPRVSIFYWITTDHPLSRDGGCIIHLYHSYHISCSLFPCSVLLRATFHTRFILLSSSRTPFSFTAEIRIYRFPISRAGSVGPSAIPGEPLSMTDAGLVAACCLGRRNTEYTGPERSVSGGLCHLVLLVFACGWNVASRESIGMHTAHPNTTWLNAPPSSGCKIFF